MHYLVVTLFYNHMAIFVCVDNHTCRESSRRYALFCFDAPFAMNIIQK
jgi:hypothetical protein